MTEGGRGLLRCARNDRGTMSLRGAFFCDEAIPSMTQEIASLRSQ